ncbi:MULTISPECIES: sensor histidine kinase [Glycomyces]|uniref:histidine kinase n=2 Tax=Glycomyces TaxID=58113 RepID=A0A9X3PYD3_9ACTN|nr:histidine kinase [Glycomyces lechevalierae]MDA1388358.1 histidine kinase [Glycomyces lechevalierae]MDR7338434.1 signal transduction histidine kinase [Glycomyces lechevalierae]
MRGLLAAIAIVLVEFALLATLPAGPIPAGILALLAAAVVVALWQRYRSSLREQEVAVERERLRLASDMHDRIGRRLGLAAVQVAALEVRETDPERRAETRQVGDTVRAAVEDLHGLVSLLRTGSATEAKFDAAEAAMLAAAFMEAGVSVELRHEGEPGLLPAVAARAAYAVLEEGLANAAKHAPGERVRATITWEADALLVAVENPLPADASASDLPDLPGGHGLAGLRERVDAAGGLLDHRADVGRFRLSAMLPVPATRPQLPRAARAAAIGTVVLLLVLLPLTSIAGVQTG